MRTKEFDFKRTLKEFMRESEKAYQRDMDRIIEMRKTQNAGDEQSAPSNAATTGEGDAEVES